MECDDRGKSKAEDIAITFFCFYIQEYLWY